MIEILIAMAVLMVAVVSAFSSQLTSMNLMDTSRDTNTAMGDLQACMERVLSEPIGNIPEGLYPPDQPIAEFTNLHLDNETVVPTYPGFVAGSDPELLTIVLTLNWQDSQGHQRTEVLRSMKAR